MEQRTDQYNDLLNAVKILELVDLKAPRSEVLLAMWLLENEERLPPKFAESNCCVSLLFLMHNYLYSLTAKLC